MAGRGCVRNMRPILLQTKPEDVETEGDSDEEDCEHLDEENAAVHIAEAEEDPLSILHQHQAQRGGVQVQS